MKNLSKWKSVTALLIAGSMLLTACGKKGTEETQTNEKEQTAAENAKENSGEEAGEAEQEETAENEQIYVGATPLTDYLTDEYMAKADYWAGCDDTALAAVMRKAQAGEKVTIACIGGSITQGTISNGSDDKDVPFKKCYADLYFKWWEDTFPDTEFEFINAGIGATDSYLAAHRVQKDVLDYEPDLVLVEFSVNDPDGYTYEKNYDNLVRRILKDDNHPAVMLLFMGQTNGSTSQGTHVKVGFNYSLPMVSYINVINAMMEDETFTNRQLSGDTVHPSALGHAITGEILWRYFNSVYEVLDIFGEPEIFDKPAETTECYMTATILDASNLTPTEYGSFEESNVFYNFPNDWTTTQGDGGITFELTFSRLGILFHKTIDGLSGQFEVLIDGESVRTLNADFSGEWGNCAEAMEVYVGTESMTHTVEIRKAEGSTGEVFSILGLLVTE